MRRRLLLNLLLRPLLILRAQSDLALVHCPSINRNNLEVETNKQTNNTCTSDKGKQANKQTSGGSMCRGTDAGGSVELHSMWSLICNASEYVEELQRCFGDASEKHGVQYAGSYSDSWMKIGGIHVEPILLFHECLNFFHVNCLSSCVKTHTVMFNRIQ